MSNERQETVADIVADMRELAADIETGNAVVGQTVWRNYADRIEAAWKAERERAKADALVVGGMVEAMRREKRGNAAKMREALEKSYAALSLIAKSAWFMDANFRETREVMEAVEAITLQTSATKRTKRRTGGFRANDRDGANFENNEKFLEYLKGGSK